MAANSATAIPNAGMGAGTNNASAIVFRPIVWGDLDAVVDLFDRTWPQDVDKVGADMSRLISRYFVLHYLLPTTFASPSSDRVSHEGMLTKEAVSRYTARRTGEKYLVLPAS